MNLGKSTIYLDPQSLELEDLKSFATTENVFFESSYTKNLKQNSIAQEFVQLNFKKEYKLPVTTKDLVEARDLKNIIRFFKTHCFINSANFNQFDQLIRTYLNDFIDPSNKLNQLREEIDKYSLNSDKHGKLIMNWWVKAGKIRINLERFKFSQSKQSIAISQNPYDKEGMLIFSQFSTDQSYKELIKKRVFFGKNKSHSINFDSQIWQAFNQMGIHSNDYLKTLECLERNHLCMKDFCKEVNKKELLTWMRGDLIAKVCLRTNNKDTSRIYFENNLKQRIEAEINPGVTSLRIFS